jgi:hypothetical protein
MFGETTSCLVGNDILDIGSRKVDAKAKRARGGIPSIETLMMAGIPGEFDLPNVPDVSENNCTYRRVLQMDSSQVIYINKRLCLKSKLIFLVPSRRKLRYYVAGNVLSC